MIKIIGKSRIINLLHSVVGSDKTIFETIMRKIKLF